MPTRFYLPSSGAAVVNPAFDASWDASADSDRLRTVTAKANTSLQSRALKSGTGDTLFRQYVSDPLNAGSVSGTVKGQIQAVEATNGTFKTQIVIRVVNRAGTTVRGTLLASGSGYGTDWVSTLTNRIMPGSATALSAVTAQQGDRIVIEVGTRAVSASGRVPVTMRFGDPTATSDLAENETQTTAGDPWVELSQALSFEPGGGPPAPVATAPVGGTMTTPRELVEWRLMLCDMNGVALADITRVALDKTGTWQLNRAAAFGFNVPSDHAAIKTLHSDGYPFLKAKMRTVKAYRKEGSVFVLRFAGDVALVEDAAQGDEPRTAVTCFDPLKHLERRLCRDSSGGTASVAFDGDEAAQIARILIDRANVLGATGVATDGTFDTTATRIVLFSQKPIAAAITELADADFDLYFAPVERSDGILCSLNCYQQLGVDRPDVIFAWDQFPASASGTSRTEDGTELANVIVAVGAAGLAVERTDATSIGLFRRHEVATNYNDATDSAYLSDLADAELAVRKDLRERIVMNPTHGRAAEPFSHFFVGDTVRNRASTDLRGGFTRTDRLYGFSIAIDDDGSERLTSVILAASV